MQPLQIIFRRRKSDVLLPTLLAALNALAVVLTPSNANAVIYQVDRSFGGGVTLDGTVDIPLGSYTIVNAGPSPFTSVNLTLTVNGTSYGVDNVLTGGINNYVVNGVVYSPEFLINATPTSLIFSTYLPNGMGSADLVFSDKPLGPFYVNNRYSVGYDSGGQFEAVSTDAGSLAVGHGTLLFPLEWGVAVPEPSMLGLLTIPCVFQGFRILRGRNRIT
jgi:hypothetical protein